MSPIQDVYINYYDLRWYTLITLFYTCINNMNDMNDIYYGTRGGIHKRLVD